MDGHRVGALARDERLENRSFHVRGRQVFAGARHVRFGAWEAVFGPRLPPDLPRDRPIVIYCAVGWRSGKVAARLAAAGHQRV